MLINGRFDDQTVLIEDLNVKVDRKIENEKDNNKIQVNEIVAVLEGVKSKMKFIKVFITNEVEVLRNVEKKAEFKCQSCNLVFKTKRARNEHYPSCEHSMLRRIKTSLN